MRPDQSASHHPEKQLGKHILKDTRDNNGGSGGVGQYPTVVIGHRWNRHRVVVDVALPQLAGIAGYAA